MGKAKAKANQKQKKTIYQKAYDKTKTALKTVGTVAAVGGALAGAYIMYDDYQYGQWVAAEAAKQQRGWANYERRYAPQIREINRRFNT